MQAAMKHSERYRIPTITFKILEKYLMGNPSVDYKLTNPQGM